MAQSLGDPVAQLDRHVGEIAALKPYFRRTDVAQDLDDLATQLNRLFLECCDALQEQRHEYNDVQMSDDVDMLKCQGQDDTLRETSESADGSCSQSASGKPLKCGIRHRHKCLYKRYRPIDGTRAVIKAQRKEFTSCSPRRNRRHLEEFRKTKEKWSTPLGNGPSRLKWEARL